MLEIVELHYKLGFRHERNQQGLNYCHLSVLSSSDSFTFFRIRFSSRPRLSHVYALKTEPYDCWIMDTADNQTIFLDKPDSPEITSCNLSDLGLNAADAEELAEAVRIAAFDKPDSQVV